MKIGVDITGLDEYRQALEEFSERRLNAAVATALTRTAVTARDELKRTMQQVFDRPTPYTLRSLWVMPATANAALAGEGVMPTGQMLGPGMPVTRNVRRGHLESMVYVKDDTAGSGTPATRYLLPQVDGGQRQDKGLERNLRAAGHLPPGWYVVPGAGARLDPYGNISRGQIIEVLSQLRITPLSGVTRGMSRGTRRAIGAQRRAGGRYFVIRPGEARVQPGVYQREFAGRNITPVLIFVRRTTYRPRLDFDGIVRQVAARDLPAQVRRAIGEQWARLQAKRAGGGA